MNRLLTEHLVSQIGFTGIKRLRQDLVVLPWFLATSGIQVMTSKWTWRKKEDIEPLIKDVKEELSKKIDSLRTDFSEMEERVATCQSMILDTMKGIIGRKLPMKAWRALQGIWWKRLEGFRSPNSPISKVWIVRIKVYNYCFYYQDSPVQSRRHVPSSIQWGSLHRSV